MNISFVIITGGTKSDHLVRLVKSIFLQKIPNYEILIVGNTKSLVDKQETRKVIFDLATKIPAPEAASKGELGVMRNLGCEKAQFENIVILDDDLLLTKDWYKNLLKFNKDYDILTCQIRVPDGGRFWDHACYQSPKNGHITYAINEER